MKLLQMYLMVVLQTVLIAFDSYIYEQYPVHNLFVKDSLQQTKQTTFLVIVVAAACMKGIMKLRDVFFSVTNCL